MYYEKAIIGCAFLSTFSAHANYYHRNYSDPQYIINNDSEENPDRYISFYSGYLPAHHNSYDLATFGLELLNVGDYLLHKVDIPSAKIAGIGIFSYIYYIYQMTYHEIGHGLRIRAHKLPYQMNLSSDDRPFSKNESFWTYFIRSFIKFNTSGRTSYYPLNRANKILAKERLIVAAGGINHEMYLAERIADGIWNGNLRGSLPIGAYMWARISPMLYSFNSSGSSGHDINNIEKFAKELGVNISKSKLQTAYTISLLGGTIYSMICHLSSHNNDIEPVTFNNFRIPDIFPYVTSYGVSYKFVSGYKMNDIVSFNLGYERVFHGKRKHEFSLGINSKLDILDFGANIYFGCVGLGIDAIAAIKVTEKISLNLRLASYATRGLMGERHAKSYFKSRGVNDKESTRNNMISLGVSYWYGH